MSDGTGIEWTDATWNPIRGCSRVSEGCRNCYAERVAARFSGQGMPYEGLAGTRVHVKDGDTEELRSYWTGKTKFVESVLDQPLRWKRPRKIFVNSMGDLFHESLSNETIAAIFGVMALADQHVFQVLTKRPARMVEWFQWIEAEGYEKCAVEAYCHLPRFEDVLAGHGPWPLPNVWLGCTVEDQKTADERIPLLLETPASVRFLSCEPLLGPVDLERVQWPGKHRVDVLRGGAWDAPGCGGGFTQHSDMKTIDWVIAGGESGPGARPMHPEWARSLRDQCAAANVPFFFKQWGEWAPNCLCRLNEGSAAACKTTIERPQPGRMGIMFRCGKKAAGSKLDEREHKNFPSILASRAP